MSTRAVKTGQVQLREYKSCEDRVGFNYMSTRAAKAGRGSTT